MYMGYLQVFKVISGSFAVVSKWLVPRVTFKMAGLRVQQIAIWDSRVLVGCIWGTVDLVVFKVILGIILCNCLKMTFISKKTGFREKWAEILDCDGDTIVKHLESFDLSWGSFTVLVFIWPITQKQLVVK